MKDHKDSQKKIIFGINDFTVGGVQKLFIEQAHFFNKNEFRIILITLFQFSNKQELYNKLPKCVEIYKFNFRSFKDIKSWVYLYKLLKELKPDIVVSSLFFSNTVFRILKPIVGYVAISCEHNTYKDKTKSQQLVDRLLAKVSYNIVAVSNTVANFTAKQEKIPRDKFVVIHNGVDVRKIQNELNKLPPKERLKEELGFQPSDKILLNVARLTQQKNHKLLIESFSRFAKEHPEHKLVILGEGGLQKKLNAYINKYDMQNKILMLGYKDPVPYYKISNYFILTSDIEGFAIVGIEAMACGLPMLSTKTAGPDEYLHEGENGFFIEESTVESTVLGMKRFVDFDLEKLQEGAMKTAEQFDIRNTEEKYSKLIKNAL